MEASSPQLEVMQTPEAVEVQTGTDALAQAQAEIAEARTAYNEAILGVLIVGKSCGDDVKPEADSFICACEKRIAAAQEAYDQILVQFMPATPVRP